jgi:hypothetical protein
MKILGTLEFDEIWLVSSLLYLIARKNKFSAKEDQKFELSLKMGFGMILQCFKSYTSFLNFTFEFRIVLVPNYLLMTLIRVSVTWGVTTSSVWYYCVVFLRGNYGQDQVTLLQQEGVATSSQS